MAGSGTEGEIEGWIGGCGIRLMCLIGYKRGLWRRREDG
jgi:hypothetical protein